MVLLVYSVISPITNFVVAFCFVYMGSIFRHQFIYIYPARSDSGGKMWINFIRVLVSCMFIGEVTSTLNEAETCDAFRLVSYYLLGVPSVVQSYGLTRFEESRECRPTHGPLNRHHYPFFNIHQSATLSSDRES